MTGAESNPSIEMIPENTLNLVRQGINVNMRGTSKTDTQNFSSEVDTICIYRSGGTFADGLYRRVGVIDNPGATEVNFVDTADDLSIAGAPIAEFDNDAPVTSDIGQEYKYNLKQNYSKGVSVAIELKTVTSGLRDILTPGTIVNIGGGIAGATGSKSPALSWMSMPARLRHISSTTTKKMRQSSGIRMPEPRVTLSARHLIGCGLRAMSETHIYCTRPRLDDQRYSR